MVLKRKRSASELCSSPSASSTCSSSTFSFSSPPTALSAPIFWDNSNSSTNVARNLFSGPAHLNSRTMKRFRDGRPSEELIHPQQQQQQQPLQHQQLQLQEQPESLAQEPAHATATPTTMQNSLHRFWTISSAPKPPTASTLSQPQHQNLCAGCEDCGAPLDSGMMEMGDDDAGPGAHACGACGKHVCFSCSVSNLGAERRCLQCAGRGNGAGCWADGAMQMG